MKYSLYSSMKQRMACCLCVVAWVLSPLQAHLSPAQSLEVIERQLEADPDNTSLMLDKAHVLIVAGRLGEAEAVLQQVDELEAPRSADTLYLYTLLAQTSGDLDEAFELSDHGIERFPENFFQWKLRGQLALAAGKTDEAIKALGRSLSLDDSGSTRSYLFLVNLLLERGMEGDMEKAVEVLRDGIVKLGNPSALLHLSIKLNTELERYDDALEKVDRLEAHFGAQIPFAVKRAELLELAGRNAEAARAYGAAVSLLEGMPEDKQGRQVEKMKALFQNAKERALAAKDQPQPE